MTGVEGLDPEHIDPVIFAQKYLGWKPDAVQAEVLRDRRDRVILNWGRQSGKSTVAAAKMLHTTVLYANRTAVWVSAAKEHTAEVFARMRVYLERLGLEVKTQRGISMSIVLPNGSRILGLAARDVAVRSYTAHLLVIDEAAQVKDEVHDAATALLAVNRGVLWMLGTPRGRKGRFFEVWSRGDEREWKKSRRKTIECGRVSMAFLESERRLKGEALVAREYECEFERDGEALLQEEDVERLFRNPFAREEEKRR
jgi:hypothetical protein